MQILFAISILSFIVLLWAVIAITRRIRPSHNLASSPQPKFSQYLFAAAEAADLSLSHTASQPLSPDSLANRGWAANPNHTRTYDKATSTERG